MPLNVEPGFRWLGVGPTYGIAVHGSAIATPDQAKGARTESLMARAHTTEPPRSDLNMLERPPSVALDSSVSV